MIDFVKLEKILDDNKFINYVLDQIIQGIDSKDINKKIFSYVGATIVIVCVLAIALCMVALLGLCGLFFGYVLYLMVVSFGFISIIVAFFVIVIAYLLYMYYKFKKEI